MSRRRGNSRRLILNPCVAALTQYCEAGTGPEILRTQSLENEITVYKKQMKELLNEKRKLKDTISDLEKESNFMKERLNIFEK